MRSLRMFLTNVVDGKGGREPLEWSNIWIDSANVDVENKILMIGDSTARMVRSTFAKVANKPVDMIGTSSPINDVLFVDLIDYFFRNSQCKYEAIFVQLGHHGRTSLGGGKYEDVDYLVFEESFRGLILYLEQFCDHIIVETIFDSVVPFKKTFLTEWLLKFHLYQLLYKLHLKQEVYDESINQITSRKNLSCKKVAEEIDGVELLDINEFMHRQPYIHTDHIHFEQDAKKVIASAMCQKIKNLEK